MDSAFYYHGLTTDIPDLYHIATPAKSARLRDKRIRQVFVNDSIFTLGQVEQVHKGTALPRYSARSDFKREVEPPCYHQNLAHS